jgi:LPXTG-motif cell wall-anchored protein
MSEEFSDDFIIEEEEQGANRTFLIIAGSLVGVLLLIIGCVAVYAFINRGNNAAEIAAIETANAETAAQNARVTETIVAMELTANAPTPTYTPSPTSPPTNTPTATPEPTDTAVVQTPETAEPGDGTLTATPNLAGTQIFGGDGGTFGTSTPISGTGTGGSGSGTGTGTDTLPQTGFTTAGAVAIGLLLIGVLIVARRLRTG